MPRFLRPATFALLPLRRLLSAMLLLVLAAPGCGRKGAPLPPLSRIPDAIAQIQARRVGNDVYVTFVIPSQNIDASKPGDVARVEIFAVTTDGPPPRDPLAKVAQRIASVPVSPPPAPGSSDVPAPASPGGAPAPRQGDSITIRESLGAPQLTPTVKSESQSSAKPEPAATQSPPEPAAIVVDQQQPDQSPMGPRRYYAAVAVSDRNRSVQQGAFASVPVDPAVDAPSGVTLSNTAESLVVTWTPLGDDVAYNVYREDTEGVDASAAAPWSATPPAPLNSMPLTVATFSEPVEFGREHCFRVRAIRAGVEGEASQRQCRTAEDTFPPSPPRELVALTSGDGGITLKWAANSENDLAGYLILRGQPGDATLLPITPNPVTQTTFTDREVKSGARYVYAVIAVDSAPTPNRSQESERDEVTAP